MIVVVFLAVLIVLVAYRARGLPHGPLDVVERNFLVCAPVPIVLSLFLPGLIALSGQAPRVWGTWLTRTGGWLSLALMMVGALLLVRRSLRQQVWERWLVLGLALAALPAVSLVLIALMHAAARGA